MAVTTIPTLEEAMTQQTSPIPPLGSATGATVPQDDVHTDGMGVFFTTRGGKSYLLDGTPYNPIPITPARTQPQLTYEQQMALATAPRISSSSNTSSSTSQSIADPRTIQLQQEQLAETIRQNNLAQKNLEIQRTQTEAALAYNKTKDAYAQSVDNKKLALEAQGQVTAQSNQVAAIQLQIAGMQAQREQINATIAQQNADRALAAQKANLDFQSQHADRLQSLATNIGQLAANPIDYGKYASTVLANGGGVFGGAGKETTDNRTGRSLAPLQSLLDTRSVVQGENTSPYVAQQTTPLGPLDLSQVRIPGMGDNPSVAQQIAGGYQPDAKLNADRLAAEWNAAHGGMSQPPASVYAPQQTSEAGTSAQAGTPSNPTQAQGNASLSAAGVPDWVPRFAQGGLAEGAFVAGDSSNGREAEELIIPLGPGQALVLNKKMQAKMKPEELKRLKKMADGGVFNGGNVITASDLLGTDTSGAREFSDTALQSARQGTPWQGQPLPTSVYASSPGFNPVVAQMLGSLRQLGGFEPASEFQRLANVNSPGAFRAVPYGLSANAIGRTA